MTSRTRPTAKRVIAEMMADIQARRKDAAWILREALAKKLARPGYVSKDTREFVAELIAEVEA